MPNQNRQNPYSPSGRQDIFGDGTPIQGRPFDLDGISKQELAELKRYLAASERRRGPVVMNPSAGSVHRQEQNMPWRAQAQGEVLRENRKAEIEIREKRVLNLARQTHQGLLANLGVYYGIPEFTTIFERAQDEREREKRGEEVKKNVTHANLLVAAEQYDLQRVAALLGLKAKGKK